jgi:DNA-binding transcriptional LysR family regulator
MIANADRFALVETFIRIVEAGSLSAAAKQLGTTQPTISRRLGSLERSLGVPLLSRTTHAMHLTPAGERYFARARELLAEWQTFEADLRGHDAAPEGTLRVVVPHAFGQQQLIAPVMAYLRRYPRMNVEWKLTDKPLRWVEDGIDCLIRVGAPESESLVVRKLGDVARVIVAAPGLVPKSAKQPAQLAALPWAALATLYRNSVRLESARGRARIKIQPRFVTDNMFALRNAALAGMGLAVLSTWAVREDLEAGRLVRVLPQWQAESLPIYLAYPQARFYPARLRRFVEMVRAGFGEVV